MKSVLVGALAIFVGMLVLQAILIYVRRTKAATEDELYKGCDRGTVLHMIQTGRRIQATRAIRKASGVSIAEALAIVKRVEAGDVALLERYVPFRR
jgi:hypothetical protein